MVHTRIETISPEKAYRYLEGNIHNRPIRQHRVRELADAMRRGEWKVTHQGLAFGKTESKGDQILVDGQHRLWAIVESGVTVEMMVTLGIDPETFKVIDTGTSRSNSDTLAVLKEPYYKSLADALSWLFRHENGMMATSTGGSGYSRPSNTQVEDMIEKHPAIRNSLRVPKTFKPVSLMPRGIAIWLHYEFSQRDVQLADMFFSGVGTGEALRADDPRYVLRARLLDNMANKQSKLHSEVIAAIIIKTWNAFVARKTLRTLRWEKGGTEEFPVILDKAEVVVRPLRKAKTAS